MKRAASEWRRVLIVDDDRDTRDMYCESLKADGFEATSASSGEEALRLAAHLIPAVVVTDLRLKGKMDGLELVRRLRADSRTEDARIILLTGASFDREQQYAQAAGCDRFLVKPCLPGALALEIHRLVVAPRKPDGPTPPAASTRAAEHRRKA